MDNSQKALEGLVVERGLFALGWALAVAGWMYAAAWASLCKRATKMAEDSTRDARRIAKDFEILHKITTDPEFMEEVRRQNARPN